MLSIVTDLRESKEWRMNIIDIYLFEYSVDETNILSMFYSNHFMILNFAIYSLKNILCLCCIFHHKEANEVVFRHKSQRHKVSKWNAKALESLRNPFLHDATCHPEKYKSSTAKLNFWTSLIKSNSRQHRICNKHTEKIWNEWLQLRKKLKIQLKLRNKAYNRPSNMYIWIVHTSLKNVY